MKVLREIIGFILTFSLIFIVSFSLMNFSSVKSILSFYYQGEKVEESIESSIGEKKIKTMPLAPSSAKKLVKKEFPQLYMALTPPDYRLVIPKIGVNVPLVEMSDEYISNDLWGDFEKEVQIALRDGVVHYPGTANPGQLGNAFFTGHSSYYEWDQGRYKNVFANLVQLKEGDTYYVYYKQRKFKYIVKETKEVLPTEVGVLNQPEDERLSTIMTCWPLGTVLRRLIVIGQQV
jgi:LPXTG-site transpeptidase (sortase) family protein